MHKICKKGIHTMKILLAILLCTVLLLPSFSFAENIDLSSMSPEELNALINAAQQQLDSNLTESEMMKSAVALLKDTWLNDSKLGYKSAGNMSQHGYLEILHTQLSYISESASADESLFNGIFYNVYCVIDFVLLSDYYGTEPYYVDAGINTSIVVYRDGTAEVCRNSIFAKYSARTYSYDYSDIISSVKNLGSEYNATFYLLDP